MPIHILKSKIEWHIMGTHKESLSINKYPKTKLIKSKLVRESSILTPLKNHIGIWAIANNTVVIRLALIKLNFFISFWSINPLKGISSNIPTINTLIQYIPILKFILVQPNPNIILFIKSKMINKTLIVIPLVKPFFTFLLSFKNLIIFTLSFNLR